MPNRDSQSTKGKSKPTIKDSLKHSDQATRHRPLRRPMSQRVGHGVGEGATGEDTTTQQRDATLAAEDALHPLPHGDFREVDWSGMILNGCDATGANFSAATMIDFCALGANFSESQFEEAQLQNAALCGANLTRTNLRNGNLRNANLSWCTLRGANLFAVDLRGANLAWADLREADLREVNLTGAYYNLRTQWPIGFDPTAKQMICLTESR